MDAPRTICEELVAKFTAAVQEVVDRELPDLSEEQKEVLLGQCAGDLRAAVVKVCELLFATHCWIEAAKNR